MKRRLLSIVLCVVLCMATFSVQTYGAEDAVNVQVDDQANPEEQEENKKEDTDNSQQDEIDDNQQKQAEDNEEQEQMEEQEEQEDADNSQEEASEGDIGQDNNQQDATVDNADNENQEPIEDDDSQPNQSNNDNNSSDEGSDTTQDQEPNSEENQKEDANQEQDESEDNNEEDNMSSEEDSKNEEEEPSPKALVDTNNVPSQGYEATRTNPLAHEENGEWLWLNVEGYNLGNTVQEQLLIYQADDTTKSNLISEVVHYNYNPWNEDNTEGDISSCVRLNTTFQEGVTYKVELTNGTDSITYDILGAKATYSLPHNAIIDADTYCIPLEIHINGNLDAVEGLEHLPVYFYGDEALQNALSVSGQIKKTPMGSYVVQVNDPNRVLQEPVYYEVPNDVGCKRRVDFPIRAFEGLLIYDMDTGLFTESSKTDGEYIIKFRQRGIVDDLTNMTQLYLKLDDQIALDLLGNNNNGVTFEFTSDELSDICTISIDEEVHPLLEEKNYRIFFKKVENGQTYDHDFGDLHTGKKDTFLLENYEPYAVSKDWNEFNVGFMGHGMEAIYALDIYEVNGDDKVSVLQEVIRTDYEEWHWSGYGCRWYEVSVSDLDPNKNYEMKIERSGHTYTRPLQVAEAVYDLDAQGMVYDDESFYMHVNHYGYSDQLEGKTVAFYGDAALTDQKNLSGEFIYMGENKPLVLKVTGQTPYTISDNESGWYYTIEGETEVLCTRRADIRGFEDFALVEMNEHALEASNQNQDSDQLDFVFYTHGINEGEDFELVRLIPYDDSLESIDVDVNSISVSQGNDVYTLSFQIPKDKMVMDEHYKMLFKYEREDGYGREIKWYDIRRHKLAAPFALLDYEPYGMPEGWTELELRFIGYQLEDSEIRVYEQEGSNHYDLIQEKWYEHYYSWDDQEKLGSFELGVKLSLDLQKDKAYYIEIKQGEQVIRKALPVDRFTYSVNRDGMVPNDTQFYMQVWFDGDVHVEEEVVGKTVKFYTDSQLTTLAPMEGEVILKNDVPMIKVDSKDGVSTFQPEDNWYIDIEGLEEGIIRTNRQLRAYEEFCVVETDYDTFYQSTTEGEETKFVFYTHGFMADLSNLRRLALVPSDEGQYASLDLLEATQENKASVVVDTSDPYADTMTITIPKSTFEMIYEEDYKMVFAYDNGNGGGREREWHWFRREYPEVEFEVHYHEPEAITPSSREFHVEMVGCNLEGADLRIYQQTDDGQVDMLERIIDSEYDQWSDEYKFGKRSFWVRVKESLVIGEEYYLELSSEKGSVTKPLTVAEYTYLVGTYGMVPDDTDFYLSLWLDGAFDIDSILGNAVHFYKDEEMTAEASMIGKIELVDNVPMIKVNLRDGETETFKKTDKWYYKIDGITGGARRRHNGLWAYAYFNIVESHYDIFQQSIEEGTETKFLFYVHGIQEDLSDLRGLRLVRNDDENDAYDILAHKDEQVTFQGGDYVDKIMISIPNSEYIMKPNKDYMVVFDYDTGSEKKRVWSWHGFKREGRPLSLAYDNQRFIATHGMTFGFFSFEGYGVNRINEARIYKIVGEDRVDITDMEKTQIDVSDYDEELEYGGTNIFVRTTEPLDQNLQYELDISDGRVTLNRQMIVSDNAFYIWSYGLIEGETVSYVRIGTNSAKFSDQLHRLEGIEIDILGQYDDPSQIVGSGVIVEKEGLYYVEATLNEGLTYQEDGSYVFQVKESNQIDGKPLYIANGEENNVTKHFFAYVDNDTFWNSVRDDANNAYELRVIGSKICASPNDYSEIYLHVQDDESRRINILSALDEGKATYTVTESEGLSILNLTINKELMELSVEDSVMFGMTMDDNIHVTQALGFKPSFEVHWQDPLAIRKDMDRFNVYFGGYCLQEVTDIQLVREGEDENLIRELALYNHSLDHGNQYSSVEAYIELNHVLEEGNYQFKIYIGNEVYIRPLTIDESVYAVSDCLPIGDKTFLMLMEIWGEDQEFLGKKLKLYEDQDKTVPLHFIVNGESAQEVSISQLGNGLGMGARIELEQPIDSHRDFYYEIVGATGTMRKPDRIYTTNDFRFYGLNQERFNASQWDHNNPNYEMELMGYNLWDINNIDRIEIYNEESEEVYMEVNPEDITLTENDGYYQSYILEIKKTDLVLSQGTPIGIRLFHKHEDWDTAIGRFVIEEAHGYEVIDYKPKAQEIESGGMWFHVEGYHLNKTEGIEVYDTQDTQKLNPLVEAVHYMESDAWHNGRGYLGAHIEFKDNLIAGKNYYIELTNNQGETVTINFVGAYTTYDVEDNGLIKNKADFVIPIYIYGDHDRLEDKQVTFYTDKEKQNPIEGVSGQVLQLGNGFAIKVNMENPLIEDVGPWYYKIDAGEHVVNRWEQSIHMLHQFNAFNEDFEGFKNAMKGSEPNYIIRFRHNGLDLSKVNTLELKQAEGNGINLLEEELVQYTWDTDEYSDILTIALPKTAFTLEEGYYRLKISQGNEQEGYYTRELGDFEAKIPKPLAVVYQNQLFKVVEGYDDVIFLFEGYGVNRMEEARSENADGIVLTDSSKTSLGCIRYDDEQERGLGTIRLTLKDGMVFQKDQPYTLIFTDGETTVTKPITVCDQALITHRFGLRPDTSGGYIRVESTRDDMNLDLMIGETLTIKENPDTDVVIGTGVIEKKGDLYYVNTSLEDGRTYEKDTYYYHFLDNPALDIYLGDYCLASDHYYSYMDEEVFVNSLHEGSDYVIHAIGSHIITDPTAYSRIFIGHWDNEQQDIVEDIDILEFLKSGSDAVSYDVTDAYGISELYIRIDKSIKALKGIQGDLLFGMYKDEDLYIDRFLASSEAGVKKATIIAQNKVVDNPYITFKVKDMYLGNPLTVALYETNETGQHISSNLLVGNSPMTILGTDDKEYTIVQVVMDLGGTVLYTNKHYSLVVSDSYKTGETGVVFPPTFEPDYDYDEDIDMEDFHYLLSRYNVKSGDEGYNTLVDINEDEVVDLYDLVICGRYVK